MSNAAQSIIQVRDLEKTFHTGDVDEVDEEGFVIDNVAVDPAHQGSGVGHTLLELAEAEAERAGFDSLYLYTHEKATENLALYERIGYVEYDRRIRGEARIVYLRKTLPRS